MTIITQGGRDTTATATEKKMRCSQARITRGAERDGGWPEDVIDEAIRAFDAVHHGCANWYRAPAASQLGFSSPPNVGWLPGRRPAPEPDACRGRCAPALVWVRMVWSGNGGLRMNTPRQAAIALSRPCFDPMTYDMGPNNWQADRDISASLTVNIGME